MNADLPNKTSTLPQLPTSPWDGTQHATDTAKDAGQRALDTAKGAAQHAVDSAKGAAQHATAATKDMCHEMSVRVEDTMARTRDCLNRNPVPVVLGALAFGAALGYLIVMTRREEPTFRERFVDEPLHTAREAIYAVLAPVAQRLHEGYDAARDGAGKALDQMHDFHPSRSVNSWSGQLRRMGSNLKFW